MASPTDAARQGTNISTAATSHAINVGSPTAGTLLVVAVRYAAAPGTTTFAGYTRFASDSSDASDDTTELWFRLADGNEGATDTLTTGNSVKLCAIGWEITGGEHPGARAPEVAINVGTTANADPTTVTPTGGSKDYLFLVVLAMDHETATFTSPSTYSAATTANSGTTGTAATNCQMAGASLQATGSSQNPGAWTSTAATTGWTSMTVAIHPVTTATTPNAKVPWHGVIVPPRMP